MPLREATDSGPGRSPSGSPGRGIRRLRARVDAPRLLLGQTCAFRCVLPLGRAHAPWHLGGVEPGRGPAARVFRGPRGGGWGGPTWRVSGGAALRRRNLDRRLVSGATCRALDAGSRSAERARERRLGIHRRRDIPDSDRGAARSGRTRARPRALVLEPRRRRSVRRGLAPRSARDPLFRALWCARFRALRALRARRHAAGARRTERAVPHDRRVVPAHSVHGRPERLLDRRAAERREAHVRSVREPPDRARESPGALVARTDRRRVRQRDSLRLHARRGTGGLSRIGALWRAAVRAKDRSPLRGAPRRATLVRGRRRAPPRAPAARSSRDLRRRDLPASCVWIRRAGHHRALASRPGAGVWRRLHRRRSRRRLRGPGPARADLPLPRRQRRRNRAVFAIDPRPRLPRSVRRLHELRLPAVAQRLPDPDRRPRRRRPARSTRDPRAFDQRGGERSHSHQHWHRVPWCGGRWALGRPRAALQGLVPEPLLRAAALGVPADPRSDVGPDLRRRGMERVDVRDVLGERDPAHRGSGAGSARAWRGSRDQLAVTAARERRCSFRRLLRAAAEREDGRPRLRRSRRSGRLDAPRRLVAPLRLQRTLDAAVAARALCSADGDGGVPQHGQRLGEGRCARGRIAAVRGGDRQEHLSDGDRRAIAVRLWRGQLLRAESVRESRSARLRAVLRERSGSERVQDGNLLRHDRPRAPVRRLRRRRISRSRRARARRSHFVLDRNRLLDRAAVQHGSYPRLAAAARRRAALAARTRVRSARGGPTRNASTSGPRARRPPALPARGGDLRLRELGRQLSELCAQHVSLRQRRATRRPESRRTRRRGLVVRRAGGSPQHGRRHARRSVERVVCLGARRRLARRKRVRRGGGIPASGSAGRLLGVDRADLDRADRGPERRSLPRLRAAGSGSALGQGVPLLDPTDGWNGSVAARSALRLPSAMRWLPGAASEDRPAASAGRGSSALRGVRHRRRWQRRRGRRHPRVRVAVAAQRPVARGGQWPRRLAGDRLRADEPPARRGARGRRRCRGVGRGSGFRATLARDAGRGPRSRERTQSRAARRRDRVPLCAPAVQRRAARRPRLRPRAPHACGRQRDRIVPLPGSGAHRPHRAAAREGRGEHPAPLHRHVGARPRSDSGQDLGGSPRPPGRGVERQRVRGCAGRAAAPRVHLRRLVRLQLRDAGPRRAPVVRDHARLSSRGRGHHALDPRSRARAAGRRSAIALVEPHRAHLHRRRSRRERAPASRPRRRQRARGRPDALRVRRLRQSGPAHRRERPRDRLRL